MLVGVIFIMFLARRFYSCSDGLTSLGLSNAASEEWPDRYPYWLSSLVLSV